MSRTMRPVRTWTKATVAGRSRLDRGQALHLDLCGRHHQMGLDWPPRIPLRCAARSPVQGIASTASTSISMRRKKPTHPLIVRRSDMVAAPAVAAAKKAPKQLPAPNSDFYQLVDVLTADEGPSCSLLDQSVAVLSPLTSQQYVLPIGRREARDWLRSDRSRDRLPEKSDGVLDPPRLPRRFTGDLPGGSSAGRSRKQSFLPRC
jgi:hypothetical protein